MVKVEETDDVVRFRVFFSSGYVGTSNEDTIEIPRSEWDEMSKEQRRAWVEKCLDIHISNYLDSGFEFDKIEDDPFIDQEELS